jgi:hypothetical protein
MAKHGSGQVRRLVRVSAPAFGPALMRRIGPRGTVTVALPHAPAHEHQASLAPHAAHQAGSGKQHGSTHKKPGGGKHHSGGGHHGGSSGGSGGHHTLTDAEVVQIVLAALQGGALRLAVQDVALQVFWQLQAEQQSAMQQGGSYQRMGGF